MTITLTPTEASVNMHSIQAAKNGEMCKIAEHFNVKDGRTYHVISPDVTKGGWSLPEGNSFHGSWTDGDWRQTGLGTFYLISCTGTRGGGCILEFTDDLNPDLP